MSLCADISALEVRIKQVGPNTTGVNGFALKKSGTQVLRHGDKLEILLGQYIHIVEFEPPPSVDGNKRKLDETSIVNKKLCGESLEKDSGLATPKTSSDSKWETIDNGKLLIYTSKHVVAQSKVKRNRNFYIKLNITVLDISIFFIYTGSHAYHLTYNCLCTFLSQYFSISSNSLY